MGQIGMLRGAMAERWIEELLPSIGSPLWPDWIISGRKATKEEDSRGIDFVFETTCGELHIQVKKSRPDERVIHSYNRRGIGVVIARRYRPLGLRNKVIYELNKLRSSLSEANS